MRKIAGYGLAIIFSMALLTSVNSPVFAQSCSGCSPEDICESQCCHCGCAGCGSPKKNYSGGCCGGFYELEDGTCWRESCTPNPTPTPEPTPTPSCGGLSESCCCAIIGDPDCNCTPPYNPSDPDPALCYCEDIGPTPTPMPCGGGPGDAALCCPEPNPCNPPYEPTYEADLCICWHPTKPPCHGVTTGLPGSCILFAPQCPEPPLFIDGGAGEGGCDFGGYCCVDQCNSYDECVGESTGLGGFCYLFSPSCPTWDPWNWIVDKPVGSSCGWWGEYCCVPPAHCSVVTPANTPTPGPGPGEPGNPLCVDAVSIDTAIGCIPVSDVTNFAGFMVRWGMGIGGGISFLLTIAGGFMIITSAGSLERIKAGKELITAAISGLALIIFSVFILEMTGFRILRLPGF